MRRFLLLLAILAVLLAACGGASTDPTPGDGAAPTGSTEVTTGTPQTDDGSVDAEDDTEATQPDEGAVDDGPVGPRITDFEGPVAADFTIDLNKTGTFTLSEEARPVYLVFWAEW